MENSSQPGAWAKENSSDPYGMDHLNLTETDEIAFYGFIVSLINAYKFIKILSIVCYSITFVLGVLGNGLVIWVATFRMKTVSSVWFLNLAIADLICNIAITLRIADWALIETDFNMDLCNIGMTVMSINMFSSVYFLTVISVDRCVSVMWPFWSRIYRTRRVASIVAACTWLLCVLSSLPHVIRSYTHHDSSDCFPKYEEWFKDLNNTRKIDKMFIIRNLCMFSFPFVIITVSYVLIIYKVKSIKRSKSSQRHLKVIIVIVLCFFICWFPYNTWSFVPYNAENWKANMIIAEICVCLAYFNSCINPMVYVFFSQDFKEGFLKSMPAKLENLFSERPDVSPEDSAYNKTSVELATTR